MIIIKENPVPKIRFTCSCCGSEFEGYASDSLITFHSYDNSYSSTCPVCNNYCDRFKVLPPEDK